MLTTITFIFLRHVDCVQFSLVQTSLVQTSLVQSSPYIKILIRSFVAGFKALVSVCSVTSIYTNFF